MNNNTKEISDIKKRRTILDSKEADELKNNVILKKCLKDLRDRCIKSIECTDCDKLLKENQLMLKTIKRFELTLESFIEKGKLAEKTVYSPRQLEPLD